MRTLISGGIVVSMDPAVGDLNRGDVLIADGVIVDVAERIDAPDAEVIDATDRIVLPGFVDTHRHTWQTAFRGVGADWTFAEYLEAIHGRLRPRYRPEDVYLGNLLGRLEALHSGVTTMLDWFHCAQSPGHADAAVAALRDTRAGRSSATALDGAPPTRSTPRSAASGPSSRRRPGHHGAGTARTGTDHYGHCSPRSWKLAAELGLRTSVHIESGGTRRPIADLCEHGLLRDTTTIVHANGIGDDELRMLADAGCSVSISPDIELKMGFGWPMTGRMLAAGLRPTLSIDDTPSVGGDMFATMRTAYVVQRGLDGGLRSRDVLEFATVDGARACGLATRTGSITPGKDADVILLRADDLAVFPASNPVGTIVAAGNPGLVDTVLVAGRVVKRNGVLVNVDLPALRARLFESRNRVAAAAGTPLDGTWRPRPES